MAAHSSVYATSGRWNNAGIALAIIAGLTMIGVAHWPMPAPQGRGDLGPLWAIGVWIVGLMNIVAAFLVDRHRLLAKVMLTTGALWLAGLALVSAEILRTPTLSWLAAALDLLPAAIALIAAVLIGPIVISEEEEAIRTETLSMPDHRGELRNLDRAA